MVKDQIVVPNAGTYWQSVTTVMEEFTLINKQRNRIKVFKPFEDISKPSPSINAMEISYGCVYQRSSKPVIKGATKTFGFWWLGTLEQIKRGQ